MGQYNIFKNQVLEVDVIEDFYDLGWAIAEGRAIHRACNSGIIRNKGFVTEPGVEYKLIYTVSDYTLGSVYPILGGVSGPVVNSAGSYTVLITAADDSGLSFWSDGNLTVMSVRVAQGSSPGSTELFNDNNKKWVGERSYVPEFGTKFLDEVVVFQNGQPWLQNSNEIRNNFFGNQYESAIEFYVNVDPTQIKNFYSMRLKSNKAWSAPEINIIPREGKENGQFSRIKKGNFRNYQGDWFADFMKDMNDPRFDPEDALFMGADLQGGVAKIRIENDDTVEVRLMSVDVTVAAQDYTY